MIVVNPQEEKGLRFNSGKVKWGLVDFKSLECMVKVLEFGAKKYAPFNWALGLNRMEILESLQRHLVALIEYEQGIEKKDGSGNCYDEESGIHHIGHILCNAMFYSYFKEVENV